MSPTSKDEPNLTQPNPIPTQSIMFTLSIWLEGNQPPSISSVGSTITLLGIRTIRPTCKTVNISAETILKSQESCITILFTLMYRKE